MHGYEDYFQFSLHNIILGMSDLNLTLPFLSDYGLTLSGLSDYNLYLSFLSEYKNIIKIRAAKHIITFRSITTI